MLKISLTSKIGLTALFAASNFCFAAPGDIGRFTSDVKTFSTVSYWIEGTDGVVMIDTQFLPREGISAVIAAEKVTGKKVTTAIILHPNPDKFNGTAAFQARGINVITAKQVSDAIPSVHTIRYGWFFDEYKPDYPKDAATPTVFGDRTISTIIAGLPLTLHVLNKGTSAAHVVVQYKQNVYVGDLINPSNHAWLELGLIDDWLARLNEIKQMQPIFVFPGRGQFAGSELINQQANYLMQVQRWVQDEKPNGTIGYFAKRRLQNKIEDAYPTLGYPIFMRDGLEAIWRVEGDARRIRLPK